MTIGSLVSTKKRQLFELLLILAGSLIVFAVSAYFDLVEKIVTVLEPYNHLQLDEILLLSLFLSLALALFSARRWSELHQALAEIRQLRGLIPICAGCKKIRDDEGLWHQVELYFHTHADVSFSHGLCPECTKKLYPEIADEVTAAENN